MDTHTSVWPIEGWLWTCLLQFAPSSWGDGVPTFSVLPQIGVMDSHTSMWPRNFR